MRTQLLRVLLATAIFFIIGMPTQVVADDLTKRIQKDLVALGYDPGNIKGEADDDTVAAIAQFQSERDMPVTGEVSPLLAGMMSAEVNKQRSGGNAAAPAAAPQAARDPAELQAAQQACLQQKIQESQAANKKKRGFGRLLSAVSRTAGLSGNNDMARTTRDIYSANATADDLSAAARDLGLTEDEVAACQNPM